MQYIRRNPWFCAVTLFIMLIMVAVFFAARSVQAEGISIPADGPTRLATVEADYAASSGELVRISAAYALSSAEVVRVATAYGLSSAEVVRVAAAYAASSAEVVRVATAYGLSSAEVVRVAAAYAASSAEVVRVADAYALSSAEVVRVAAAYAASSAEVVRVADAYALSSAEVVRVSAAYGVSSGQVATLWADLVAVGWTNVIASGTHSQIFDTAFSAPPVAVVVQYTADPGSETNRIYAALTGWEATCVVVTADSDVDYSGIAIGAR